MPGCGWPGPSRSGERCYKFHSEAITFPTAKPAQGSGLTGGKLDLQQISGLQVNSCIQSHAAFAKFRSLLAQPRQIPHCAEQHRPANRPGGEASDALVLEGEGAIQGARLKLANHRLVPVWNGFPKRRRLRKWLDEAGAEGASTIHQGLMFRSAKKCNGRQKKNIAQRKVSTRQGPTTKDQRRFYLKYKPLLIRQIPPPHHPRVRTRGSQFQYCGPPWNPATPASSGSGQSDDRRCRKQSTKRAAFR